MIKIEILLWLFLHLVVISLELMGSQEISALCACGVKMKATPSVCSAQSFGRMSWVYSCGVISQFHISQWGPACLTQPQNWYLVAFHLIGNDGWSSGLIHGPNIPFTKNGCWLRWKKSNRPCRIHVALPAPHHSLSLRQALFLRVDGAVEFH